MSEVTCQHCGYTAIVHATMGQRCELCAGCPGLHVPSPVARPTGYLWEIVEDRCRVCGKSLGATLRFLHVGVCTTARSLVRIEGCVYCVPLADVSARRWRVSKPWSLQLSRSDHLLSSRSAACAHLSKASSSLIEKSLVGIMSPHRRLQIIDCPARNALVTVTSGTAAAPS